MMDLTSHVLGLERKQGSTKKNEFKCNALVSCEVIKRIIRVIDRLTHR